MKNPSSVTCILSQRTQMKKLTTSTVLMLVIGGLFAAGMISVSAAQKKHSKPGKKELIYEVDTVKITYIKKNPPEYRIDATGKTPTSGWSNAELSAVVYVQPPPDGIYDFHFNAEPPSGIPAQVFTPISATKILEKMPNGFRGVRVHAASNKKEALLAGMTAR
jgi:hypothetical protein